MEEAGMGAAWHIREAVIGRVTGVERKGGKED